MKVEICFGFGLVAAAVVVEKLVAELGYFVAIVVLVVSSAATACIYSHHTYPLQLSPIKTPRSSSECTLVVCFRNFVSKLNCFPRFLKPAYDLPISSSKSVFKPNGCSFAAT